MSYRPAGFSAAKKTFKTMSKIYFASNISLIHV